ncbi:MAG: hypothetical protein ABJE66_32810 [Deltaproteobacteria bacterium]
MKSYLAISCALAAFAACGGHHGTGDDAGGTGGDGSMMFIDAPPFNGMCTPGGPQCSNCKDDDGDGLIDGFDPECTGPFDNDEGSFATGIPGDNKDAINQDCFFDGNSGGGDDGCNQHVCCLFGATTKAECQADLVGLVNNPDTEGNKYDVTKCFAPLGSAPMPAKCAMVCGAITPPGCDCFGCCTVCEPGTTTCFDIALNPIVSPNCTQDNLADPAACKRCVKTTTCGGGDCGGTTCVLCAGENTNDLPPDCGGTITCPANEPTCPTGSGCPDQTYCAQGCCIGVIQ